MAGEIPNCLFSLDGRVAVVTGGTGSLGSAMALGLAVAGAAVGVLGRRGERAQQIVAEIADSGAEAMSLLADVRDRAQIETARDEVLRRWDRIDILVNAAGGNVPGATVGENASFFDLPLDAFEDAVDLNLIGTVLPSQVFGAAMARNGSGCIVNVSSMTAQRALSRVVAYSAGKAAVENFTRWLAVELAHKCGPGIRVNAIAPGFFLTDQNRELMMNPDGTLAPRGRTIVDHTPLGRLGDPGDLIGTLIWLCGPGAEFVTGAVIPVDGGFSAFSGV